tara:strand:- start:1269 stop:2198 length:930 start_codon:yes stop_codon:yes gene_type:complete
MSNILIIKHGSLGDIVQISGVLRDIRDNHQDKKIFILTTTPYLELLSTCPYLDAVLVDKRLPRWNLIYLFKLKKLLQKFNFSHVYDLQNSSRTSFYRKYLINIKNWSSTETVLKNKKELKHESVLHRFKMQLENSEIKTRHCLKPDFSWAGVNVDKLINKYSGKKFIIFFPFCSPNLSHKKWPYFNELANIIKSKHSNLEVVVAPGPNEIEEAKRFDAISILKNEEAVNVMELAGLILKSSYIVANDTGPAHMAAHLGKMGLVIFGYHTTPKKVSIETDNFKAITVENLKELKPESVYEKIKDSLELIH